MDKQEFANVMKKLANKSDDDPEMIHIEMDNLMLKTLKELGYEEGVRIFESATKYYG